MNRPIKFRAQRLASKDWVYGDLIKHSAIDPFTYISIGTGYKIDDPELGTAIKVYPHTVGQLTGLTDENGREIWEGDIIKDGDVVEVVEWGKGGFGISDDYMHTLAIEEWEVIGNVYEHPNLIA